MTYNIIYETCPFHTRAALMDENGKLLFLCYDDPSVRFIEDVVVLGVVRKVSKGLGAAFVDIGDVVDGFLPLSKLPKGRQQLNEGDKIPVRIDRSRMDDKGARLNGNVILDKVSTEDCEKAPCILKGAPSALSRALMEAGATPVKVWIVDARSRTEVIPAVPETKVFQLDQHEESEWLDILDEQLETLHSGCFQLKGGARLVIESTKALTSIDVDVGGYAGDDREQVAFEVNMVAAAEVARLCRLLNIGGSIIVDFVSIKNNNKRKGITSFLKQKFEETDMRRVDVLEMSPFGLLEMNREKTAENYLTLLKEPPYVAGEVLLKMWRTRRGLQTFEVEASPMVTEVLKERLKPSVALAHFGGEVALKENKFIRPESYSLSGVPL